jgi:hypothetical protein
MATKYLLIPEQLYKGLLQDEPENINLDHEKKLVEKIKKIPKNLLSTKNTLYNQEIKRLIKFNKEIKEKPIKVQLTDGSHIITKNPSISSQTNKKTKNASTQSSVFDEKNLQTPKEGLHYLDNFEDPSILSFSDLKSTEFKPTPKEITPKYGPSLLNYIETPKRYNSSLDKNKFFKYMHDIIKNSPKDYGVSPTGYKLKKDGKTIPHTDFVSSLDYLLDPTNKSIPPGTDYLEAKIRANPQSNFLYTQFLSKKTEKEKNFNQKGKGKRKNILKGVKILQTKTNNFFKFKPKLWTK